MNNSQVANLNLEEEQPIDRKPFLRQREIELVKLIEAIENLKSSNYWNILEDFFTREVGKLRNELDDERDTIKIYRLQGNLEWAKKYSDLSKLSERYREELINIRKQINV